MRIAVVGAGAIGCLFGIGLHRSGHEILLINHNHQVVASIKRNGLTLTEKSGKTFKTRIAVRQFLSKRDKPDLVLLTVKAYDTRSVANVLTKVLDDTTPILSLQNGLGNIDTLSRYLPRSEILAGTTTEPALLTRPGFVMHPGRGVTWVGELRRKPSTRSTVIRRLFERAGFQTHVSANIENVIWSKAIVNSAINPVSALARVPNGEILRNTSLRNGALRLLSEGVRVARAFGVHPSPSPKILLSRVLESTRTNRSSMLRDIEAGRKTEIQQLNGSIVSYGKRLGVSVPGNTLITDLMLGLETSSA